MEKNKMYRVYDKLAKIWGDIWWATNDESIMRDLKIYMEQNPTSPMTSMRDDLELYFIGELELNEKTNKFDFITVNDFLGVLGAL